MNQQEEQAGQESERARIQEKENICPSCGQRNDADARFCAECGSGLEHQSGTCPVCGELSAGAYCEFCGSNIEGTLCPSCSTRQHADFCAECGTALTQSAIRFSEDCAAKTDAQTMSDAEAQRIVEELNGSLSPKMLNEMEKQRQRIILLREREYSNEREKRIAGFRSAGTVRVKSLSPEEMENAKRSAERLRGLVEAEKGRIAELERARLFESRVDGVWIGTSGTMNIVMKITRSGTSVSGTAHFTGSSIESIDWFEGTWDMNTVSIRTVRMKTVWICEGGTNVPMKYSAKVNADGDRMSGYIYSAGTWQEIFIKQ